MRNLVIALFVSIPLVAVADRASPHEKVTATLGAKHITIEYGRPAKKGRDIFGALVPFDAVWRTGADEATVLTADADVTIGTIKVPKGSYALFTIPGKAGWTLIVNKTAKQWGAFRYDAAKDVGRAPMKVAAAAAPVEQFTIAVDKGTLTLSWDKTVATIAIE